MVMCKHTASHSRYGDHIHFQIHTSEILDIVSSHWPVTKKSQFDTAQAAQQLKAIRLMEWINFGGNVPGWSGGGYGVW